MKPKILIPIVAMVSVFVMFIWSYLEGNWSHSWLAVMAGGIVIVIISMLIHGKENDKGDQKDKE